MARRRSSVQKAAQKAFKQAQDQKKGPTRKLVDIAWKQAQAKKGTGTLVRETKNDICSVNYAGALLNPFNGPSGVCIPSTFSPASGKYKVFSRLTMSTGSNNFGFVLVQPTAANDLAYIHSSGSTYAGTTLVTTGTGVTSTTVNSPFAAADFSTAQATVKARLVAAGVRIRFIGTEVDRGGQVIGLVHPDHSSMAGMTLADIRAFSTCYTSKVNREWHSICYNPIQPDDLQYHADPLFGNVSNAYMAFVVQAPATAAGTFEVEIAYHFEAIGPTVRNPTREVVSNANRAAKIISFFSGHNHDVMAKNWKETAKVAIKAGLPYVAMAVRKYGPLVLESMGIAAFM